MRTYVQAELAPVHSAFSQMSSQVWSIADRMGRFEAHDRGAASTHVPNPHDSAFCKIAFIGFPKEAPADARVAAMEQFMEQNFMKMQMKHIDVSLNRSGELTSHVYVEVGSKQHARLVTSTAKKDHFAVSGFDKVSTKPEDTDVDKNRNWAFNKAG